MHPSRRRGVRSMGGGVGGGCKAAASAPAAAHAVHAVRRAGIRLLTKRRPVAARTRQREASRAERPASLDTATPPANTSAGIANGLRNQKIVGRRGSASHGNGGSGLFVPAGAFLVLRRARLLRFDDALGRHRTDGQPRLPPCFSGFPPRLIRGLLFMAHCCLPPAAGFAAPCKPLTEGPVRRLLETKSQAAARAARSQAVRHKRAAGRLSAATTTARRGRGPGFAAPVSRCGALCGGCQSSTVDAVLPHSPWQAAQARLRSARNRFARARLPAGFRARAGKQRLRGTPHSHASGAAPLGA